MKGNGSLGNFSTKEDTGGAGGIDDGGDTSAITMRHHPYLRLVNDDDFALALESTPQDTIKEKDGSCTASFDGDDYNSNGNGGVVVKFKGAWWRRAMATAMRGTASRLELVHHPTVAVAVVVVPIK